MYSNCWGGLFGPEDLAYPEEEEVDELYVEGQTVVLSKGPYRIEHKPSSWDLDLFNEKARLILTHQEPRVEHFELFGCERKWIYIVRDGRAVINSLMHFLVTPVLLKRHPDYKITDVRKLYQLPGYVEKHIKWWKNDIDAFQRMRDRYLLVRYEDLTAHKTEQISRMLDYIGISEGIDLDAIALDTSFQAMKATAPVHVRKGEARDWADYFSDQHIKAFKRIAGDALIQLGYEDANDW